MQTAGKKDKKKRRLKAIICIAIGLILIAFWMLIRTYRTQHPVELTLDVSTLPVGGFSVMSEAASNAIKEAADEKVRAAREEKISEMVAGFSQETQGYMRYALSQFNNYGWPDEELVPLIQLWDDLSMWNPYTHGDDGAHGIPLAQPGEKMASEGADWQTNPETQIRWGLRYIWQRYDNPSGALRVYQRTKGY